jgi:hypothetical protein
MEKAGGLTLKNLEMGTQNNVFKVENFKKSLSFAHLSGEQLNALAAHATTRYFPKKKFVFHEGDRATHLWIVQDVVGEEIYNYF